MSDDFYRSELTGKGALVRLLAPFFPRYRVLRELESEPEHLRYTLRNMILTHDRRLLYVRNQKAACTQTTRVLYAYSNAGAVYKGNVHRADRGFLAARYRWPDIRPVLRAGDAFTFTFVRHPERRIVSAYTDFFVDDRNLARRNHIAPLVRSFGFVTGAGAERNFDPFLDYIENSLRVDRMRTSTHFRPQVDNIAIGQMKYDLVGKVENYSHDIRRVFRESGLSTGQCEALFDQKSNTSRKHSFSPSQAQRQRIETLFAEDYEAFGY